MDTWYGLRQNSKMDVLAHEHTNHYIWGVGGLRPLQGAPTQLFNLICVLHWKWPLLNWWPKKCFPNIPPIFMNGVQVPQAQSHFEEAVYFLPLSPQKFLVLTLLTLEGWKAESTLEPPSGFEQGNPELGIQCLNHKAIALNADFVFRKVHWPLPWNLIVDAPL